MCLIIVTASPWCSEIAVKKASFIESVADGYHDELDLPSSILSPALVWHLFFNQLFQVDAFIELISFCAGVAYETLGIEVFCGL